MITAKVHLQLVHLLNTPPPVQKKHSKYFEVMSVSHFVPHLILLPDPIVPWYFSYISWYLTLGTYFSYKSWYLTFDTWTLGTLFNGTLVLFFSWYLTLDSWYLIQSACNCFWSNNLFHFLLLCAAFEDLRSFNCHVSS